MNKRSILILSSLALICFTINVHSMELDKTKQEPLIKAIEQVDFKTIDTEGKGKKINLPDDQAFLDQILSLLKSDQYKVRAGAAYLLALFTQNQKLPENVYKLWNEAATEKDYKFHSEPFYADTCMTWIRQLGIYELGNGKRMGLSHATCPVGGISKPLMRTTMSEDFYVISGKGEFWLKSNDREIGPFVAQAGEYIANPNGMHVQFRNIGDVPLTMLVPTLPPYDDVVKIYPGDLIKEIHVVNGPWDFAEYLKMKQDIMSKTDQLLKENTKQAISEIANIDNQYLRRFYLITKSIPSKFANEKIAIISNPKENWALREAAIQSLDAENPEVRTALEKIEKEEAEGVVKNAAKIALQRSR